MHGVYSSPTLRKYVMQAYSDFFKSGLSNISESNNNSPNKSSHFTSSHPMPSVIPGTKSRRRHTMIPHIQNILNLSSPTSYAKNVFDNTKGHRCVFSLLPRPSKKWFGNIFRRASARLDPGESSVNDEPVETRHKNVQDPQAEMLDPFSPSLDSTSYFIDKLGIHDETWVHHKCVSITQLSIHPLSHSASRYFEYRERSISIQTSPSPQLASQRFSLQQWSVSSEESDSFNWREDGPLSPSLPLEKDGSADIDWREFHDSLLYNVT
ncbi:hypothetical protein JOM56_015336 [Amanita muscaria]